MKNNNYFSIVTPKGEGGIGIIHIFGKDVLKIINRIFTQHTDERTLPSVCWAKKPLTPRPRSGGPYPYTGSRQRDRINSVPIISGRKLYLGYIYDPDGHRGEKIDEVIIHFQPARLTGCQVGQATETLTGLDTIEINAHGGIISCQRIATLLKRLSVKERSQKQLINIAYDKGQIDIYQKEALEHLLFARTPLVSAVLLDQYKGALSKAMKSAKNYQGLLDSAKYGIAMTHPKRIVIIGRPNVGKSTLFNALLGKERALTHHIPGTTRDFIEESVSIHGFPFILVDTAGLYSISPGRDVDRIEKQGISYSRKEISRADIILFVVDPVRSNPPECFRGDAVASGRRTSNGVDPVRSNPPECFRGDAVVSGRRTSNGVDSDRHLHLARQDSIAEILSGKATIIIARNKTDIEPSTIKQQVRWAPARQGEARPRPLRRRPEGRASPKAGSGSEARRRRHCKKGIIKVSALKRTGLEELRKAIIKGCGLDKFVYTPHKPIVFTPRQLAFLRKRGTRISPLSL
ncbi:MAG: 50S ribosome-binding GTPase [Planctomycetota bacterium]|nr:50S ribosome-binding GTPase [Planctomycetota bacterium]MDI6787694.1 50S ribosome-binding GTPase [Planctomycetota bacterium]